MPRIKKEAPKTDGAKGAIGEPSLTILSKAAFSSKLIGEFLEN